MSVKQVKSLLFRSLKLQSQIDAEQKRRWPDWMRLLHLKKARLVIKDRIAQLVRISLHHRDKTRLQPAPVLANTGNRQQKTRF